MAPAPATPPLLADQPPAAGEAFQRVEAAQQRCALGAVEVRHRAGPQQPLGDDDPGPPVAQRQRRLAGLALQRERVEGPQRPAGPHQAGRDADTVIARLAPAGPSLVLQPRQALPATLVHGRDHLRQRPQPRAGEGGVATATARAPRGCSPDPSRRGRSERARRRPARRRSPASGPLPISHRRAPSRTSTNWIVTPRLPGSGWPRAAARARWPSAPGSSDHARPAGAGGEGRPGGQQHRQQRCSIRATPDHPVDTLSQAWRFVSRFVAPLGRSCAAPAASAAARRAVSGRLAFGMHIARKRGSTRGLILALRLQMTLEQAIFLPCRRRYEGTRQNVKPHASFPRAARTDLAWVLAGTALSFVLAGNFRAAGAAGACDPALRALAGRRAAAGAARALAGPGLVCVAAAARVACAAGPQPRTGQQLIAVQESERWRWRASCTTSWPSTAPPSAFEAAYIQRSRNAEQIARVRPALRRQRRAALRRRAPPVAPAAAGRRWIELGLVAALGSRCASPAETRSRCAAPSATAAPWPGWARPSTRRCTGVTQEAMSNAIRHARGAGAADRAGRCRTTNCGWHRRRRQRLRHPCPLARPGAARGRRARRGAGRRARRQQPARRGTPASS